MNLSSAWYQYVAQQKALNSIFERAHSRCRCRVINLNVNRFEYWLSFIFGMETKPQTRINGHHMDNGWTNYVWDAPLHLHIYVYVRANWMTYRAYTDTKCRIIINACSWSQNWDNLAGNRVCVCNDKRQKKNNRNLVPAACSGTWGTITWCTLKTSVVPVIRRFLSVYLYSDCCIPNCVHHLRDVHPTRHTWIFVDNLFLSVAANRLGWPRRP